MIDLRVYFDGDPGGDTELEVRTTADLHGGRMVGAGIDFVTGIRDNQFRFDNPLSAARCRNELAARGLDTKLKLEAA